MTLNPTPKSAAAILACAAIAGCNSLETTTQAQLAPEPRGTLVAATTQPSGDVAIGTETPIRDWNRTVAEYQNGDTASNSTGVRYISDTGALFGKGGRTTRSDVSVAGGTGGATAGGTATAGGPTVASSVAAGSVGPGGTATPAVASGVTVDGQVARADGSIVPAGSPGAAGSVASIGVAPGSPGATVAPDVSATAGAGIDGGNTSIVTSPAPVTYTNAEQATATLAQPFVETGTFFANVVTSPVTFWQQRDGIVSGGYEFPPTYTAMPRLPYEKPRKAPKAAPPSVAAPTMPLVDTGVYPTTNRAASDVTTILPSTKPVTPLVVPTTKPTAMTPSLAPTAGRKPGTLKRAADVSPTAFVIAGAAPYAGRYEVEPNLTVDAALRGAGVMPADASSLIVTVQRRGAATPASKVTLAALRAQSGDAVMVKPGDIITVSPAN